MSNAGQKIAAVVLAAGKGTRMKSERAKVLHEMAGRPIAFFPIRAALALDASPVVVVVGYQAESVKEELGRQFAGAPVRFALQAEQLGTGHAVLCAQEALRGFDGSVLILAADVPLLRPQTLQRLVAARQGADVKASFVAGIRAHLEVLGRIVGETVGEQPERKAIAILSTMVGALMLSRVVNDPDLAQAFLDAAAQQVRQTVAA